MKKHLNRAVRKTGEHGHYLAWTIAVLSLVGSLYYSEVMHFVPCVLCWWARILIYPLVVIIGIGIIRRRWDWIYYVWPLSVAGFFLEGYHTLLNWKVIPETAAPCQAGVSCTTLYVNYFGFINIPFMAWVAFTALNVVMFLHWKHHMHWKEQSNE